MWRTGYHRSDDDSVSSFGGHESYAAAINEVWELQKVQAVDRIWVRDNEGDLVSNFARFEGLWWQQYVPGGRR
jgi:hypothetical protein